MIWIIYALIALQLFTFYRTGKAMEKSWKRGIKYGTDNYEALVGNNGIKHFEYHHFTAVTKAGRKFVYCPVGNICSWSEGDYDHKWCPWCKKGFEEISND